VRLVDRQDGDARPLQGLLEALVGQALRGDVEQIQLPGREAAQDVVRLLPLEGGVQPGGAQHVVQLLHLIAHQGEQRRDHQHRPLQERRGSLKGEALARTGGHHPERAHPAQGAPDEGQLRRPGGDPEALPHGGGEAGFVLNALARLHTLGHLF
jgi:hypothetical protein